MKVSYLKYSTENWNRISKIKLCITDCILKYDAVCIIPLGYLPILKKIKCSKSSTYFFYFHNTINIIIVMPSLQTLVFLAVYKHRYLYLQS
jgi:hypothetical protein